MSTVQFSYASASFHGVRGHAHTGLPRCLSFVYLHLELGSSADNSMLGRHDGSTALDPRRDAAQSVATIKTIFRNISRIPFRLLRWLSPRA